MNRSVENMYQVGDTIAGYRVVTVLGHGGMGEVYKASHPRLPRADAIKVLRLAHATDPVFRARFEREADIVAPLSHPNIVSVYDRGVFDDQLWIAMEFVPGTDVAHILEERGPLPPQLVIAIISGVAAGLDAAHRSRVTHRDIKPANILVTPGPNFLEPETVKLTDFGIAQALDEATSLTGTGTTVGTMRYASPEQIEGKQVDARSDIYSLGATAYELLTGAPPFDSPSLAGLMTAHMFHEVPRASSRNGALNPAVDGVLARAMAKDPAQRYQTARDFATALSEALQGRVGPSQQSTVPSNFGRPAGQFSGPPTGPGRISAPTLAGGGTVGAPPGPPGGPPTDWTPTQGYPNGQPGPQGQPVPPAPTGPKPWYRKLPALGAAIILLAAALGVGSGFVASSADALPTPSPPSAKAAKGTVEVEWSKVDGATSYVVMQDDRQVYSGSATSVKVPSPLPGVYTYKVAARADSVRGSDFSLPSDEVRVFLDWGVLQPVADLYPDLVPATPLSTNGYDSAECWGEDGDLAFRSTQQVIVCDKSDPATKKDIYEMRIDAFATPDEADAAAKVALYDVKGTPFTTTQGNKGTLYLKESAKFGPSAYLTFSSGDRARTFIEVSGDKLTSKQAADIVAKLPI